MTTSCISPTFLCKVTSLQKIGEPADLLKNNRKSPQCNIFSQSHRKHSCVCVQHGYISSRGTVGEGVFTVSHSWSSLWASDTNQSITKPSQEPSAACFTKRCQPMARFSRTTRFSTAPHRTDWKRNISKSLWSGSWSWTNAFGNSTMKTRI